MSILFASQGFGANAWQPAIEAAAGDRPIAVDGIDAYDPETIRYALVWQPPRERLAALPNLEAIFNLGAGVDALLADPTLPDVPIVRIVDPNMTMRMTEWVVLQVLMHHRHALGYLHQQQQRDWRDLPQPPAAVVRVGIMGLGALGADAASALARLGFQVAGWSRTAKSDLEIETFVGAGALDAFLGRTDILVVLLPLTRDTHGLLNRELFAKLAQDGALGGPFLINAGRGRLQVEADIVAALDNGTLKGVSLDVFETEPLPAASPLWTRPDVIVTPHVAADSSPDAICRNIFQQIAAYERGEGLKNVVDRGLGY
ncbi:2-hydroxyacid dehydrogenase [Amorphus sp. 3PC139-8]|uniref:2-hydroxyacid dehydrogenase n=1 Tax=Amorphus sp. 3PC139-8 TaxID=2735676 RepID=UPI00345D0A13